MKARRTPNGKRYKHEWYLGAVFFATLIFAHLAIGESAAVKVLGLASMGVGIYWMCRRSVPIGIEGRTPSFFANELAAFLLGLAMFGAGIFLLANSELAGCLLGWMADSKC